MLWIRIENGAPERSPCECRAKAEAKINTALKSGRSAYGSSPCTALALTRTASESTRCSLIKFRNAVRVIESTFTSNGWDGLFCRNVATDQAAGARRRSPNSQGERALR